MPANGQQNMSNITTTITLIARLPRRIFFEFRVLSNGEGFFQITHNYKFEQICPLSGKNKSDYDRVLKKWMLSSSYLFVNMIVIISGILIDLNLY